MSRVEPCKAVALAWNEAGIRYAAIHGLEGYPEAVGRDLDVLVHHRDVRVALETARRVFRNYFDDVVRPPPTWGERLIGVRGTGSSLTVLELHLTTEIRWRNVVLAATPHPSACVGAFSRDPWAAFAKRVVLPTLASGGEPFRERPDQLFVTDQEMQGASTRLREIVGTETTRRLLRAAEDCDPATMETLAGELRRNARLRAWQQRPLSSIAALVRSASRYASLPFRPCAPIVAVVGPDGMGKSSLLAAMAHGDSNLFNGIVIRHWRPELLPSLGNLMGRDDGLERDPHGRVIPRRQAGRFRWLRLGWYALDQLLGTILKDRVAAARQQLVLYDRCFLDMAVDPLRYGLSSGRGVRMLWRLLPKPDRVVLLTDEADRVFERKPEIPPAEIARQLDVWHGWAEDGIVGPIIRVDAEPKEMAERLMTHVMAALIELNSDRKRDDRPVSSRTEPSMP